VPPNPPMAVRQAETITTSFIAKSPFVICDDHRINP
jgi:hypothetical protein